MAETSSRMRVSTISCTDLRKVRTVPTIFASRGITLIAPGCPACRDPMDTTAESSGFTLRDTIVCKAVMICPAIVTGSMVW
ncbi:hypothetical protein D9M69_628160 [compost metagenome]